MDSLFRHVRAALRKLRRSPTFTAITIVTLAIGIGANSAIFSVVHAVLIQPLPYSEPGRLVGVWHTAPGISDDPFVLALNTFVFYRQQNRVFEDMGVYASSAASLTGSEMPEEVAATEVTASIFPILRVAPQLGRGFSAEQERPGAEPAVVLSHGLWTRRFGADPQILGQPIQVDGVARTVVGVMPPDFHFPAAATQLWLPIEIDTANPDRSYWRYTCIARLRPGIGLATAGAELSAVVKRLSEIYPDPEGMARFIETNGMAAAVHPLQDDVVGEVSGVLRILLGSVGVILLIACANVANLFLARAEGRRQEVALRTALGAGRGTVAGAFLTESTILALAGGALGLGLAAAAIRVFTALAPPGIPRLHEVGIDGPVLAFTLVISLFSSLLFGVMPALRRLPSPALALKEGGRHASGTGGRARHRARNLLVVAQLTLALVLSTGSGLMVRSFQKLRNVEPGFDSAGLLTLRLPLPEADYPGSAETVAFYQEVLERIRALPGVESAGAASGLPLTGGGNMLGHTFEDFPIPAGEHQTNYRTVLTVPGYFETLGIPLLAGRPFESADLEQPGAVWVSASLANRFWPGQSPIGKRVISIPPAAGGVWYTIAGVVGDVRFESLEEEATQIIYYPLAPLSLGADAEPLFNSTLDLAIRTSVPPTSLTRAVSSAVWSIDASLPVADVRTMEEIVTQASARTAFTMLLLVIAAGVALVLGAVGLYGVISYLVSQRTQEIGVRMALGADRGRVSRMVLRQGLVLALVGLSFGLAGAFAVTRLLTSVLYGVSPTDPLTFGSVSLLLLAITLLASYLPARRAAAVQPLEALRHE